MKYYQKSLEIPKILGLDISNLRSLKSFVEKIPILPQNISNLLFKTTVKIGSYPIELRNFEKEKEILKDDKNQIPLIFIQEDVNFEYKGQKRIFPLFRIKFNQKSLSSREFIAKIPEFLEKKAIKTQKNLNFNDFLLVFFKDPEDFEEIQRKFEKKYHKPLLFVKIVPSGNISVNPHPSYTEVELEEISLKSPILSEFPSYLAVRSDGHLETI